MMEKLRFSDCTAEFMQDTFGLTQIWECAVLDQWLQLSNDMEIDIVERTILDKLRKTFFEIGDTWNEIELIECLVSPIFALVDFNTPYFKLFAERRISAIVGEYELYGEPDAFIAKGSYTPKTPYFCFNEYKRLEDHKGDIRGQLLAAMLAAQTENGNRTPVYGLYVLDNDWHFMVVQGKAYCLTAGHNAAKHEIFDIFKILKALKVILIEIAKQDVPPRTEKQASVSGPAIHEGQARNF